MSLCPCGSGRELDQCCGPIIAGAPAPTAEALMRSRYCAFALGAIDHIERSHAPEVKEDFNRADAEAWSKAAKWDGLDIRRTEGGGDGDETGEVEFVAHFRQGGQVHAHHELATFRRVDGVWCYVDGELNPRPPQRHVVKVGRNDPCPCGSGKKFKKCCGA